MFQNKLLQNYIFSITFFVRSLTINKGGKMRIKQTTLIQTCLLTGTLLLNTGCFFGYFGEQVAPTAKESAPVWVSRTVPENPNVQLATTYPIEQKSTPVYSQPTPVLNRAYSEPSLYTIEPTVETIARQPRIVVAPQKAQTYSQTRTYEDRELKVYQEEPQQIAVAPKYSTPITPLPVSNLECTDDPTVESACEKKPISKEELQETQKTNSGGEIHKLKSIQGQTITIIENSNGFVFPEYRGKTIILEMFGKRCPHCIKEIPSLNRLKGRYRDKLEVISIQVEDKMSPSEGKSLISRNRIQYPIIPGDMAKNLQYNIQTKYDWTGVLPFTMVIKDGVTEGSFRGEVSYRELNELIKSVTP